MALAIAAFGSTIHEKNRLIPAIVWNIAIAFFAYIVTAAILHFILH